MTGVAGCCFWLEPASRRTKLWRARSCRLAGQQHRPVAGQTDRQLTNRCVCPFQGLDRSCPFQGRDFFFSPGASRSLVFHCTTPCVTTVRTRTRGFGWVEWSGPGRGSNGQRQEQLQSTRSLVGSKIHRRILL